MSDTAIRDLFDRYARLFNAGLRDGSVDLDATAALYAAEFIGAAPAGVRTGRNDEAFRQALAEGYARYRAIGTRQMRLRDLRLTAIDAGHWLARVAWTAIYARDDLPETEVDFDVSYLVQVIGGVPKVFGWVTGDEEAVLRERGIV